ncbi:KilA-N domain-containing protein [Candidatus Regiella endosymbiont of Tuberolachnus salignus]|uniref:KilA-N domain-containing protein n=1 Tax=Candidatus Regiella endosymbiont of Tuberolachnus salignus TaxID=3077956 RepID=UPI0030D0324B
MKYPTVVIENAYVRSNENGMYNLNDLHRAALQAGLAKKWQVPSQFRKSDGIEKYIDEAVRMLNCTLDKNHILIIKNGGKNSGIWAHELITLRYAAWLSPAFEFKVYQTFREVVMRGMNVMNRINRLDHVIHGEEKTISDCARKMRQWGIGGRKAVLQTTRQRMIEEAQLLIPGLAS